MVKITCIKKVKIRKITVTGYGIPLPKNYIDNDILDKTKKYDIQLTESEE